MMHTIARTLTRVSSVAALVLCMTLPAGAGGDVDLRGGYTGGPDAGFVGGGWLGDLGDSGRWYVNPNLEYAFADEQDYLTLNGDVHYDFPMNGHYTYWLGGGPAVIRSDADGGSQETDVGFNFLTGVGAREGRVRPFFQGRVTVANDSQVALAAGVRF